MMSSRRNFIKTVGALAGASLISPSDIFATKVSKGIAVGKKMKLNWENFEGVMKYTFTISGNSRKVTPIVITRLDWDGYTGYGEAAMPPYLGESYNSVNSFLAKAALEVIPRFDNPFCIEEIMDSVEVLAPDNTAAKAAIDIALHDLVGNIMGQPWWKIWGFNPSKTPNTSFTIGYDASEAIINKKVDEADWSKVLKVKLGMSEKEDKRMINLIRAKTNTPICVDANQGWKQKEYALEMINWLSERNVTMIEQPMPKDLLDESAWLRERSPLPIIADEACKRITDIPRLQGAYDGINIKLMKCTGMREAREMISLADALGMRLMMGCMVETSVAISAAAQLSPKFEWADLDGNILLSNDCFNGMELIDGKITLEDKPGIGVNRKGKLIKL